MGERRGGWIRRSLDEPAAAADAPSAAAAPADPSAAGAGSVRATTVERGCDIEGDLQLPGPLVVHGDFRGSIECGDVVTVCCGGTVQARIRARSVLILGSVVGDVEARRDVILHAGARLHGDVKTPSLVVERGAFFNGRTEMTAPLPQRSHVVPAPPPRAKLGAP